MKNQFQALKNWLPDVLTAVKKDLKNDHLHSDPDFYRAYFGNRPQNRLGAEEIFAAYEKELLKGENEDLSAFVVNRWVFKYGDLYQHFADRLAQISPDFDQLKVLTEDESEKVLKGAAETFGAVPTFLFSILNGVVFPEKVVVRLEKQAAEEKAKLAKQEQSDADQQAVAKNVAALEREIARLNDKILGVQKKYTTDTEALKKQIRALQQKLAK